MFVNTPLLAPRIQPPLPKKFRGTAEKAVLFCFRQALFLFVGLLRVNLQLSMANTVL